jgi:hypothetical protein
MIHPRIQEMLSDLNLDIDDIRWYRAMVTAKELLHYQSRSQDLAQEIWSGRLADRLHDMEETFLDELGSALENGTTDAAGILNFLQEAKAHKRRRPRH